MTIDETRQLGIEFERRVQTMIPAREFADKLDTDTIYSFLNQYQDKYVQTLYQALDTIPSGTKRSARIEHILEFLLTKETIPVTDANKTNDLVRSITVKLDGNNFGMYIRSLSEVSSIFRYKKRDGGEQPKKIVPNILISQNDAWRLLEAPYDSLRILRYPVAVLDTKAAEGSNTNPTITIMHDRYTEIENVTVLYYKQPKHFDVMTSTPCEFPMEAFDDLVSGAVDLYVQYVAGAEARKRQLQEQQQQRQQQQQQQADQPRQKQDEDQ